MLTNVAYSMLPKKVEFSITSQQMPGINEEGSFKTNIICATYEILMIEWEAVCCDLCLQSLKYWDYVEVSSLHT
jgi:hypothetical protein